MNAFYGIQTDVGSNHMFTGANKKITLQRKLDMLMWEFIQKKIFGFTKGIINFDKIEIFSFEYL
jgi:hypothetical protein